MKGKMQDFILKWGGRGIRGRGNQSTRSRSTVQPVNEDSTTEEAAVIFKELIEGENKLASPIQEAVTTLLMLQGREKKLEGEDNDCGSKAEHHMLFPMIDCASPIEKVATIFSMQEDKKGWKGKVLKRTLTLLPKRLQHKAARQADDLSRSRLLSWSSTDSDEVVQALRKKGKAHVCTICNKVFASGPALGGHMGKHNIKTQTVTLLEGASAESQELQNSFLETTLPSLSGQSRQKKKFGEEENKFNQQLSRVKNLSKEIHK